MKKNIYIENFTELKQVKHISTILLSIEEIDNFEADLDLSLITLHLNSEIENDVLSYYIKSANYELIKIEDVK